MVRRIGNLFADMVSFDNLYQAYRRARRGKRCRRSVDVFSFDLERELLQMQRDLLAETYTPGVLTSFVIHDPKRRVIQAAPFRDRVLHHALVGVIEDPLESRFDYDSYACRKGKGMDAALQRAQHLSQGSRWVLRTDIQACYPSIDHGILMEIQARTFKDGRLLCLMERIIRHGGGEGKGLPIGNLTSQWFANLYLDCIDRYIRRFLRPRGYVRYMDDMALFGQDRPRLLAMRRRLEDFVQSTLRLKLKSSVTQLHPCRGGWPFLGFSVFGQGLRLRRATWRRAQKRLGLRHHLWKRGGGSAPPSSTIRRIHDGPSGSG